MSDLAKQLREATPIIQKVMGADEREWNDGANQTLRKFVGGFQQHTDKIRNVKDGE